jgi:cell division protein FtsZ
MVMPGLINLDFADVRSVMGEMGKAMMGTGEASGDNRAIEAAEQAIANPLLDGVSMRGARGVIISITGSEDMKLMEVDEAANHIKELVDPDANIIWGSAFNNDLEGKIRVSVVATGIEADTSVQPAPAKVFAFPTTARTAEPPASEGPAIMQPKPMVDLNAKPEPAEAAEAVEMASNKPAGSDEDGDELLLDTGSMMEQEEEATFIDDAAEVGRSQPGTRSWLTGQEPPEAAQRREGGTLFERMSNIARGASKAQVDEEENQPGAERDPLDIPRFLNRQNNQ